MDVSFSSTGDGGGAQLVFSSSWLTPRTASLPALLDGLLPAGTELRQLKARHAGWLGGLGPGRSWAAAALFRSVLHVLHGQGMLTLARGPAALPPSQVTRLMLEPGAAATVQRCAQLSTLRSLELNCLVCDTDGEEAVVLRGLLAQATGLRRLALTNFFSLDGADAEVACLANYTGLEALDLSCNESLTTLLQGPLLESAPPPAAAPRVRAGLIASASGLHTAAWPADPDAACVRPRASCHPSAPRLARSCRSRAVPEPGSHRPPSSAPHGPAAGAPRAGWLQQPASAGLQLHAAGCHAQPDVLGECALVQPAAACLPSCLAARAARPRPLTRCPVGCRTSAAWKCGRGTWCPWLASAPRCASVQTLWQMPGTPTSQALTSCDACAAARACVRPWLVCRWPCTAARHVMPVSERPACAPGRASFNSCTGAGCRRGRMCVQNSERASDTVQGGHRRLPSVAGSPLGRAPSLLKPPPPPATLPPHSRCRRRPS